METFLRQVAGTPLEIYVARAPDIMKGAVWRDPERIDDWIGGLSKELPVVTFCVYGFHVGCNIAKTLKERGFDARYIRGGVSAWYAAGGPRAMRPVTG